MRERREQRNKETGWRKLSSKRMRLLEEMSQNFARNGASIENLNAYFNYLFTQLPKALHEEDITIDE